MDSTVTEARAHGRAAGRAPLTDPADLGKLLAGIKVKAGDTQAARGAVVQALKKDRKSVV